MTRFLFLLVSAFAAFASAADIITLTDETFEHQTQASTGQTTGKWFVMLGAVWCGYSCTKLNHILEELGDVDGVVTGKVDTTANPDLAERFEVTAHPTLIYLADRKLYKYHGEQTLEAMKEFVMGEYKLQEALEVPSAPGFVQVHMKKLQNFLETNEDVLYLKEDFDHIVAVRKNAAVVLMLIGASIGFFFGLLIGCSRGKSKATKEKKS